MTDETPRIVSIPVHLLVHDDYKKDKLDWKEEILKIISEVNERFQQANLPVFLNVIETKSFNLDFVEPTTKDIYAGVTGRKTEIIHNDKVRQTLQHFSFNDFSKELPPKHIAIIFIQQGKLYADWGLAWMPSVTPHICVVARPRPSQFSLDNHFLFQAYLVIHEIGHLLDACHVSGPEQDHCLMSEDGIGPQYNPSFEIDKENRIRILAAIQKYYQ